MDKLQVLSLLTAGFAIYQYILNRSFVKRIETLEDYVDTLIKTNPIIKSVEEHSKRYDGEKWQKAFEKAILPHLIKALNKKPKVTVKKVTPKVNYPTKVIKK